LKVASHAHSILKCNTIDAASNPSLGWRDVQEIFSVSARHTGSAVGDPPNTFATETDGWESNGASDWNGGARHYSIDYGHGIADALAAVRLAETWLIGASAQTSANETSSVNAITPTTTAIPDNDANSVTLTFNVTDNIDIESVQLRLGFNHANPEDLRIVVTSPDGTVSTILHPMDNGTAPNITGTGWRFNSQEFRGELSAGTWTVTITDTASGNTGSVTGSSALVFFGSSDTTNDRYVYTNEFSDYASLGNRSILTDTDARRSHWPRTSISIKAPPAQSMVNH
jgi:subtilisin-like proprotein convertase family protein